MKSNRHSAPRWAHRLLTIFHPENTLEEVEGDLDELYQNWYQQSGKTAANIQYFLNVISVIPPFVRKRKYSTETIWREAENNANSQFIMISNYFKIAFRNLSKSMRFSMINIIGMGVGMACALLIFMIVKHETEYDFHQSNRERIYRVENHNIKEGHTYPGTYTGMFNAIANDLPEAEQSVPMVQRWGSTFSAGENRFKDNFVFTTQSLFKVFDYQWLSGGQENALTEPNTVVLSRKYAEKYFGKTDVVGRTLNLDNKQDLRVTGVMEDYPATTSFPFDIIISLATVKNVDPGYDLNKWNGWNDNSQMFVLLKPGIMPKSLTKKMSAILVKYMGKEALGEKRFLFNPLSEIHYSGNFSGRSANVKMLKTLSFIGLLVLLISCFNFINLSTAQAFRRSKEVSIRKVVGSNRISLIYQFLTEAGLISTSAVLLAVIISWFTLPYAAAMLDIPLSTNDLFKWETAVFGIVLVFITTLLAGLYPALRISGMAPILALKKSNAKSETQWIPLRQSLVVMQFTVSLVLISSALLINKQLTLFQNADLGFNKNAIITTGLPDNSPAKLRVLRNQLSDIPQIKDISFSLNSASSEGNWMQAMEVRDAGKTVPVKTQMKLVDEHFFNTYGIQLIAGQWLKDADTLHQVIANEVMLERMGVVNPEKAIGQKIYYGDGPESATIVGVVKNFNVNSLHQNIDPTLMEIAPKHFYQAGIKLESTAMNAERLKGTIEKIRKIWTASFPGQVFDYKFLDEELRLAYKSELRTAELIETATFVAVLIACLGLFGLATFMAEQRTKEIGVRKVLGASVSSIVGLLSGEFLKLVIIAILIASPLAWFAMEEWLASFAYKTQMDWWIFVIAGLSAIVVALFTVSFQSIKAALTNPVKSLRSE